MTQANASFSVAGWDEKTWEGVPHNEVEGRKLTRAEVSFTYQGDIEGESTLQYLMSYNDDGTGSFVGIEKVTGSINGRSGGFVWQHTGRFDERGVWATLTVAPGSGTGELAGLNGKAEIELIGHKDSYPIVFEYEIVS